MKQFCYTSCLKGHSLNGYAGFQVRDASDKINARLLEKAVKYSGYQLPDGIPMDCLNIDRNVNSVDSANKYKLPVRLVFLEIEDNNYCLIHSAYSGKTPEEYINTIGRWGNFFSHVLLHLNTDITAKDAINTWGNPFWIVDDPNPLEPIPFPDINMSDFTENENLDTSFFENDATDGSYQISRLDAFEFIMNAYLSLTKDQKILVVAESEHFAHFLWGLCNVLPENMIKTLTFSTYEPSFQSCPARIICTYAGNQHSDPLKYAYDNDKYFCINLINGKSNNITRYEYTNYVIDVISMDAIQNIDYFFEFCKKHNFETLTGDEVDIIFRIYKQGIPLKLEENILIEFNSKKYEKLLDGFLSIDGSLDSIIRCTLESDDKSLIDLFSKIACSLSNFHKSPQNKLSEKLIKRTLCAIKEKDLKTLKRLIDKIWTYYNPNNTVSTMEMLLKKLTENLGAKGILSCSWEIRKYLIVKWNHISHQLSDEYISYFIEWLNVDFCNLENLFKIKLKEEYYKFILIFQLDRINFKNIPEDLISLIVENNQATDVIEHYFEKYNDTYSAREIFISCYKKKRSPIIFIRLINNTFDKMKKEGDKFIIEDKRRLFILRIMDNMKDLSPDQIYQIFENLYHGIKNFSTLNFLMDHCRNSSTFKKWINVFLYSPTCSWISNPERCREILQKFHYPKNSDIISSIDKNYINCWFKLFDFLCNLEESTKYLDGTNELIKQINMLKTSKEKEKELEELKKRIVKEIFFRMIEYSKKFPDKSKKRIISSIINKIGEPLNGSKNDFFIELINNRKNNTILYEEKNHKLIGALILCGSELTPLTNENEKVKKNIRDFMKDVYTKKIQSLNKNVPKEIRESARMQKIWNEVTNTKK